MTKFGISLQEVPRLVSAAAYAQNFTSLNLECFQISMQTELGKPHFIEWIKSFMDAAPDVSLNLVYGLPYGLGKFNPSNFTSYLAYLINDSEILKDYSAQISMGLYFPEWFGYFEQYYTAYTDYELVQGLESIVQQWTSRGYPILHYANMYLKNRIGLGEANMSFATFPNETGGSMVAPASSWTSEMVRLYVVNWLANQSPYILAGMWNSRITKPTDPNGLYWTERNTRWFIQGVKSRPDIEECYFCTFSDTFSSAGWLKAVQEELGGVIPPPPTPEPPPTPQPPKTINGDIVMGGVVVGTIALLWDAIKK